MALFDKFDQILQAETDDILDLAKIAGLNELEIRSIFRNANLHDLDIRNQDLSDFDFQGADFTGVIANVHTKLDLQGEQKKAYKEAVEGFHTARLIHHACLDLYHFDELARLKLQDGPEAFFRFIDSSMSLVLSNFDYRHTDVLNSAKTLSESIFPRVLEHRQPMEPYISRFLTDREFNETRFLNEIADNIIFASNLDWLKDFDTSFVRGDLIKFLEQSRNERNRLQDEVRARYWGFLTVIRTLPAYAVSLNAEIVVEKHGTIRIERVWSTLLPAVFKLAKAGTHYRPDAKFHREKMVSVPAPMRNLPGYLNVSQEYEYGTARFAPIPEI